MESSVLSDANASEFTFSPTKDEFADFAKYVQSLESKDLSFAKVIQCFIYFF